MVLLLLFYVVVVCLRWSFLGNVISLHCVRYIWLEWQYTLFNLESSWSDARGVAVDGQIHLSIHQTQGYIQFNITLESISKSIRITGDTNTITKDTLQSQTTYLHLALMCIYSGIQLFLQFEHRLMCKRVLQSNLVELWHLVSSVWWNYNISIV